MFSAEANPQKRQSRFENFGGSRLEFPLKRKFRFSPLPCHFSLLRPRFSVYATFECMCDRALNETIKGMAAEIECLRTSKTDVILSLQVEVAQLKGVVERMQSTYPVPVASPACTDQEKLYSTRSTARKAASSTGTHTSTDGSTRTTTRSSTPTARPDLPAKPQTQDKKHIHSQRAHRVQFVFSSS